ncbi:hypothetical protein SDC9_133927 [bioreactor metagenome]|uniref:Uncharacterized protein n=1 Tax=bioreactor metagenome TaxID=1076179 RepID=A0A645DCB6_9ZZZZ
MGFFRKALLVRQDAGHHAAHRVAHRHGGNFPAGEDKVSHGELFVHAFVQKPLVHALIVTADQNQVVVLFLQLFGDRLGEHPPAGGHVDGLARAKDLHHVVPAAVQRIRLHYRATPAAVGVVVHLHLLVGGVLPDLVGLDGDVAPLLGAAQNADVQHSVHRLREQGQNVNSHLFPSLSVCEPASRWRPNSQRR